MVAVNGKLLYADSTQKPWHRMKTRKFSRTPLGLYLASKHICVDPSWTNINSPSKPMKDLLNVLANPPEEVRFLPNLIRHNLNGSPRHQFLKLRIEPEREREAAISFCTQLKKCGMVYEVAIDRIAKQLSITILDPVELIRFLSGRWLELYCLMEIERVYQRLQGTANNLPWQRCFNIRLVFPEERHRELDILAMIGKKVYWIECKSGKFTDEDLMKYRNTRRLLGLEEDGFFLVQTLYGQVECQSMSNKSALQILPLGEFTKRIENQVIRDCCC